MERDAPAPNGPLAVDRELADWLARRRHRAEEYPAGRLRAAKGERRVSVIVPTRECSGTIGGVIARAVDPARAAGLVDELLVIDAASADGTAETARVAGAEVLQQDALRPDLGPALGKGDAMWRGLQASDGEIVAFLDGDTRDPSPAHLLGLLGPLLCEADGGVAFVKGTFDRPLDPGDGRGSLPHEGGRVTELMARPLLNLHAPRLAGFTQPLAGEFAARRELLEALPFPVGYGIEIALLIDALRLVGLDALAECHLGTRQNAHQPLRALGEMAYAVLVAVERRRGETEPADRDASISDGRYRRPWQGGALAAVPVAERPPVRAQAVAPSRSTS